MSNIKVGDKVKVRNSGGGTDGWVGDVDKIDKKLISVRFKEEGYTIGFYEEELEVIPLVKSATPSTTNTRMLHQLIELAKAGKRFRAWNSINGVVSDTFEHDDFLLKPEWSARFISALWVYEEIKEPRIVEFECEWNYDAQRGLYPFGPFGNGMDVICLKEKLIGGKFKVICTEVIE